MCGIAGMVGVTDENALQGMVQAMRHRGPDDQGLFTDRHVAFGVRRLAIIDLTGGHQPMANEEGTLHVAFNGEIVNFQKLRRELEAKGRRFRTRSDTEVLIGAYQEWGAECFRRLRGMFAIALYDRRPEAGPEGVLFLARDPLGIKPLYLYQDGQRLLFASEVRSLLHSGRVPRNLSSAGLWGYLAFGSVQEPLTLISGVHSLEPGTYLRIPVATPLRGVERRRYWEMPQPPQHQDHAQDHAAELVQRRLQETVPQWLTSDVPLGIFLSGGIDSAALLALSTSDQGQRSSFGAFTIAFKEAAFNEAPRARLVADLLGVQHTQVMLTAETVLSRLTEAICAMDQPTMDGLNTYFVSAAAKEAGLTVALTGLGGDELFGGYGTFRTVPRLAGWSRRLRGLPGPLPAALGEVASRWMPGLSWDARAKVRTLFADQGWSAGPMGGSSPGLDERTLDAYFCARAVLPPKRVGALLGEGMKDGFPEAPLWHDRVAATSAWARGHDPVNAVSILELSHYLPNTLLRDTDAMSMAHSLEVRPPFLDHLVVEALLSVPGPLKLQRGTLKPLLVQAAKVLPDEVVRRPKSTFTFPWALWLKGPLREEVDSTLRRSEALGACLDPPEVLRVWNDFQRGRTGWSRPWSLYVLARWLERVLA